MKKIILIIFGYLFIGFIISCCETVTHPFYDFKTISIQTTNLEMDSTGQLTGSGFAIKLEDHTLYSQANFNLFHAAYATQPCPENGNEGLKFQIVEIKVSSDQIFFDTIPANTNISELFYSRDYSDSIVSLNELDINQYLMSFSRGINPFLPLIYIDKNNLPGVEHVFTFDFKKSNGEIVSASSEPIIWN